MVPSFTLVACFVIILSFFSFFFVCFKEPYSTQGRKGEDRLRYFFFLPWVQSSGTARIERSKSRADLNMYYEHSKWEQKVTLNSIKIKWVNT